MHALKGVTFGIVTPTQIRYRKKNIKSIDEFSIPLFKTEEAHLKFNANIPIYAITLVLQNKDITLVFRSFIEIKNIFANYLIPLKFYLQTKFHNNCVMPSLGRLLWRKVRYVMYWKLRKMNLLAEGKMPSLCKLINLGKGNIF